MEKFVFDESNGLWYELHGDYYLPCLTVSECKRVDVWGRRYRRFHKEHRDPIYTAMLLNGALDDHIAEIDRQAEEMCGRLIAEMAAKEGVTEQLKADDQMEWVRRMNSIRCRAEEIVYERSIYT